MWGCGMQDQTEKNTSDASDGKQTEQDKGRYPERNAWTGGWAGGSSCLAAASDLESWHRKLCDGLNPNACLTWLCCTCRWREGSPGLR